MKKSVLKTVALCAVAAGFAACGGGAPAPQSVEIVPNEAQQKVDVIIGGTLFTSYLYPLENGVAQKDTVLAKPVLYPLYTAKGTVITRGFPFEQRSTPERTDHPHHVGSWFNFGDVNGLDFWNNSYAIPAARKARYGTIRHRSIVSTQNGASEGALTVAADWVNIEEHVLLSEETKFVFTGDENWRIINRTTTLTAQDTVTFTDNKEGLIAVRMDRAFEEPSDRAAEFVDAHGVITRVEPNNEGVNGVYRNSEGQEQESGVWSKAAKWVKLSADKNGEQITIAIIDNKNNPGYPAHSHARGYGLFATNNLGSQVFDKEAPLFSLKLNPGESVTFKHLIVIKTNGFATDEELNNLADKF
ncbi:MAG: PmoA family protein [Bacteroidales bacterium]|nr:PmoA family protein [Bacteroidales bacterium]